MKLQVIITGSTGMVGKGVLYECIDSPMVEKILLLNRSSLNINHPKVTEIIHSDLSDVSKIEHLFVGYNTCFFNMGVSSVGLKEEQFHALTYDITTHVAETILHANPECSCTYVSGVGCDSTEKGRVMWARVKGKTENALLRMGFKSAYMFRPGYIQPLRGIKSKTKIYNALYVVFKPLYPILKFLSPKFATTTEEVGKAMIYVVSKSYESQYLENKDISECANRYNSLYETKN